VIVTEVPAPPVTGERLEIFGCVITAKVVDPQTIPAQAEIVVEPNPIPSAIP
jgi:hypothetical protein